MIQCQSCHYKALGPRDLADHIMAVHGFGREEAYKEAARVVGANGNTISIYDLGSGGISILEARIVEIQRQLAAVQTDNARLRVALGKIAAGNPGNPRWLTDVDMAALARAALEE